MSAPEEETSGGVMSDVRWIPKVLEGGVMGRLRKRDPCRIYLRYRLLIDLGSPPEPAFKA